MPKVSADSGSVILVGAGPGDPELLTLKALRALQTADVVLFDDLVGRGVLDLARPGVQRVCVGKRAERQSWAQADINALMIRLARGGRTVVRLKSGDPSIFGRSGEEIAALTEAGIAVRIVPGITAGSALAAALSVSLTHRACAHSLRFVTAQGAGGGLPRDLDWRGLADGATSLIVYMGARTGAAFAARLMAEGLAPATPVVAAENISRSDERFAFGTLAGLAGGAVPLEGNGPITIGIGEAFAQARWPAVVIEDLGAAQLTHSPSSVGG